MPPTLSSIRDQVEINLMDTSNLIWSTTILDEALRAALLDLGRVYGEELTLKDLDSATTTNVADEDLYVLVKGAVAHALIFRSVGRFEEDTPEPRILPHLATHAQNAASEFRAMLNFVDLRLKQLSKSAPHSAWDWVDKGGF